MISRVPCIESDADVATCVVGLLLGVACCAKGDCSSCVEQRDKMRRSGFSEIAVAVSFVRSRVGLIDRCPICGFPPPPPISTAAPLPRLERVDGEQSGSWACSGCECPLPKGRRRFHSDDCRREYKRRTEMVSDEVVAPSPPRVYRAQLG